LHHRARALELRCRKGLRLCDGEGVRPYSRGLYIVGRRPAIKNSLFGHLLNQGIVEENVRIASVGKRRMEGEVGFGEREMVGIGKLILGGDGIRNRGGVAN